MHESEKGESESEIKELCFRKTKAKVKKLRNFAKNESKSEISCIPALHQPVLVQRCPGRCSVRHLLFFHTKSGARYSTWCNTFETAMHGPMVARLLRPDTCAATVAPRHLRRVEIFI